MAALIIITITLAGAGLVLGLYIRICFAISREDRVKGALRFDAATPFARRARALTGITSTKWK